MEYNTFAGNVRKSNCTVVKLDVAYNHSDSRCWSAIVNQGTDNIIVTHSINRAEYGAHVFDIFTATKVITDIEVEDVYEAIDLIVNRSSFVIEQPEIIR